MANTRKIAAVKNDESEAQATEASREDFEFEGKDGKTYILPHASQVKSGVYRKLRSADGMDGVYILVESIASEEALAALDDMNLEELGEVLQAWQEHAGVGVGES